MTRDIRKAVDIAIGEVVRNASNFPEKVQARMLGQDMTPLRTRLTEAVLKTLSTPPADDVREAEMRELHHFEVEQQLAETIAIVKRAQAAVLRHEHTPASLHMDSILNEIDFEIPSGSEVRPRGTVTDTEDVDALIAETRAFLAERPMGPPIYHRIGKLVAALEAARAVRS